LGGVGGQKFLNAWSTGVATWSAKREVKNLIVMLLSKSMDHYVTPGWRSKLLVKKRGRDI